MVEGGQPGRNLHLHVDGAGLDTLEGDGSDTLDHCEPFMRGARQSSAIRPPHQEHLQNKATRTRLPKSRTGSVDMVDRARLNNELQQVRMARIEAETALCEIEEMLWEVRRGPRGWRRMALADVEIADQSALPH